jgi:hypothetical protein
MLLVNICRILDQAVAVVVFDFGGGKVSGDIIVTDLFSTNCSYRLMSTSAMTLQSFRNAFICCSAPKSSNNNRLVAIDWLAFSV